jgi:hypothetical protein
MKGSRDGNRVGQLFRQYRCVGQGRTCALEQILEEDDIEVVEMRSADPGFTACLMRAPDGGGGGLIALAPGQSEGRKRFSIAHELGHYHIPSHQKSGQLPCSVGDLLVRESDAKIIEWEANDFAAEVLMPRRLFSADASGRTPSFSSVYELASPEWYHVSVTAAAWRFVQTTEDSCALVVVTDGVVEWVARSKSFRYWLEQGFKPNADTMAAAAIRGDGVVPHPERVPYHSWSDEVPPEVELFESTHAIPHTRQILSMVWVVEPEEPEVED